MRKHALIASKTPSFSHKVMTRPEFKTWVNNVREFAVCAVSAFVELEGVAWSR